MNKKDFKELDEKQKKEYARELLFSQRGTWLMGKAFDVAIKELSESKDKCPSDIFDMKLLRDYVFPLYHLTELTAGEFRKLREEQSKK